MRFDLTFEFGFYRLWRDIESRKKASTFTFKPSTDDWKVNFSGADCNSAVCSNSIAFNSQLEKLRQKILFCLLELLFCVAIKFHFILLIARQLIVMAVGKWNNANRKKLSEFFKWKFWMENEQVFVEILGVKAPSCWVLIN
jgi:hypothetical protein